MSNKGPGEPGYIMDVVAASVATVGAQTLAREAEAVVALEDELDAAEATAKELRARAHEARRRLAERMATEEMQNIRTVGGTLVYLTRNLHVSKGTGYDTGQCVDGLDEHGLGDFAQRAVSYPRLKSWVKERDEEYQKEHPGAEPGEAIPPILRKLFNIYEETTVGIRRARSK